MSNKSQRIRTTVNSNDKYLTVKLENDVDFFEILSLRISQKDVYGNFNSDYGVIIGRVIANDGITVPNAKISVFIPITDEDKERADISTIYPYTTPRDKDLNGVRYNLLPRVAVNNPFLTEGQYSPQVPVGTFPTKEEITTNDTFLEVYEKYYKFTTVTNQSGDYMIFGVPVGVQTVHMSVDITDIGEFSMTPGTMINTLGYSPSLFTDNGTKVRFSTDLETLPNIETQDIAVEVRPFWGDVENFEIGITRQDFKIRAKLVSSFSIFGTIFTDAFYAGWGSNGNLNYMIPNEDLEGETASEKTRFNLDIESKRNGDVEINVFYYPNRVSDADILSGNVNTKEDIVLLQPSEYSQILDKGMFIITVPCNRRKKIVNEFGELIDVDDDNVNGIFTEFIGFITIKYGSDLTNALSRAPSDGNRIDIVKIKVPQNNAINSDTIIDDNTTFTFNYSIDDTVTFERGTPPNGTANSILRNEAWRKQCFKFEFGNIYSIAKFNTVLHPDAGFPSDNLAYGEYNNLSNNPRTNHSIIISNSSPESVGFEMVTNAQARVDYVNLDSNSSDPLVNVFGAEWLNLCFYLPQVRITTAGTTDASDTVTDYKDNVAGYVRTNTQLVAGTVLDNSLFLRSDFHKATFIKTPRQDLLRMATQPKGFYGTDFLTPLDGNYKGTGSEKYFYKGVGNANIIQFLIDNGIL